jgi:hypothetical protein
VTLEQLAEALKAGTITLSEWTAAMRDNIRAESIVAMELAKGGRDNVTPSDWGYVGSQTKKYYDLLDQFAADIQSDPAKWLNGRNLNARMALYGQIGYSALEDDLGREKLKGGFTEEMSVLDKTPGVVHCSDGEPNCVDESNKGWQPIGTLAKIGERQCRSHDRCSMRYRKPDGNGGWIYGDQ